MPISTPPCARISLTLLPPSSRARAPYLFILLSLIFISPPPPSPSCHPLLSPLMPFVAFYLELDVTHSRGFRAFAQGCSSASFLQRGAEAWKLILHHPPRSQGDNL